MYENQYDRHPIIIPIDVAPIPTKGNVNLHIDTGRVFKNSY